MSLTLERINTSAPRELVALLDGIYVESPWIADKALFDAPRFTRDIEDLYAQMVERNRAGLPPECIRASS